MLPRRNADIESVPFNGLQNLLGVTVEHALGAREGSILQRGSDHGAEGGGLPLGEGAGGTAEQGRNEKLNLGEIVALDDPAPQSGAPVGDGPGAGAGLAVAIECETGDGQFFAALPDEHPAAFAGDAFA